MAVETASSEGVQGWGEGGFTTCEAADGEVGDGTGVGAAMSPGCVTGIVDGTVPMIVGIEVVVVGESPEPVVGEGPAAALGDTEETGPVECEAVSAAVKPKTTANAESTAMRRDLLCGR